MKTMRFGIVGVLVQAAVLWAFILISRTGFGEFGKPLIVSLAFVILAALLWRGVRTAPGYASLCLLLSRFPSAM
jgi:hypothetical protein